MGWDQEQAGTKIVKTLDIMSFLYAGKTREVNVITALPSKSGWRFRLQIIIVKPFSARPSKVDICPDLDVSTTRYVSHCKEA